MEDLLERQRERWEKTGGYQNCHTFKVEGDSRYDDDGNDRDVWCRGYYEFHMLKEEREFCEQIPGLVEVVPFREQRTL